MGRCCCIRPQCHNLKYRPVDALSIEKMTKQLCQISDFVNLHLEDSIVIIDETLNEYLFILIINFTESFSKQSIEVLIYSVHGTAFDDHINQL